VILTRNLSFWSGCITQAVSASKNCYQEHNVKDLGISNASETVLRFQSRLFDRVRS
jgi:hypothetical protein